MQLEDKIYQYLCNQENEREITLDKIQPFIANDAAHIQAQEDISERLKVKLKTGKCSSMLISQLARHKCGYGEIFGDKVEYYNSSEVCDLIGVMEDRIVIGKSFTGEVLAGFFKAHHSAYSSVGYSIVRNIKEYWFKNEKIRSPLLKDYQSIINQHGVDNFASIMNEMHTKAMHRKTKAGKLNGEWLIYTKYGGCYYYLCLAAHEEGDEVIFKNKILSCLIEFPELKNLVSSDRLLKKRRPSLIAAFCYFFKRLLAHK